jgi:hypothetical protein
MEKQPGRQCSICAHQNLALITRALTSGESMQDIASRFNVVKSSLWPPIARRSRRTGTCGRS